MNCDGTQGQFCTKILAGLTPLFIGGLSPNVHMYQHGNMVSMSIFLSS